MRTIRISGSLAQTIWHKLPGSVWAVFGLLGIGILFFHEPLFSGGIVNATDILTQQYFWNVFIKDNLFTDPCFQTWMPYINAGTPFSGGLDLLFRPITFLALLILPVHTAINYEIIIHILLLGIGMYGYMRQIGVSHLGAFLAAVFLMLNGEIVTLLNAGHVNKIGAIFPLTFVFWAFERALQRKTLPAFLLTGAALGFQFWQGHIQISFYTCIAIAIYYVVRMAIHLWKARKLTTVWKLTACALIMVVVFLLLAAVNFLPLISFAQVSERAEGVSYEFATSWSMPPEELVTYLIPGFFGFRRLNHIEDETIIAYWGRMPFTQTGRYMGILPLLLAVVALCFVRNRHVLTLSILGTIVLLLGMGKYFPGYRILYEFVPGFDKFRVPQMILFLFAFAASGLSGLGAEWLFAPLSLTKEKRLRGLLLLLILVALGAWMLTLLLPTMQSTLVTTFNEAFSRKNADADLITARFQNIHRSLIVFHVMFALAVFTLGMRFIKRLRRRWLLMALLGVSLIDLWWFNEKFIATIPLENSIYTHANDTIRYSLADAGLHRLLLMTNTPATYNVANKTVLYKLFSVSGYEAVGVQYYNEFLQQMRLGSPLVDLLNIKYIALPRDTQFEEDKPVEVGDVYPPYKVVMVDDALLLENLNVLPRAYAVHNAYVIPTAEEIFATMYHPEFDPREYVIFEEPPQVQLAPANKASTESQVDVTDYLNRTIRLNALMAADGFVVLSEKYYRGWKAYVDGQPVPIYKANYTLQAIAVPQGEHEVTFMFQPAQFRLGFGITLVTAICLFSFWIIRKTVARKRLLTFQKSLQQVTPVLKNILLFVASLVFGLIVLELVMRHTVWFQHGGDREPRNDPDLTWQKPDGVKRVVVLGDSLTFGDGVKADETYPRKLQEKLNSRLDGNFQVVNLGIMGINIDQEAMILREPNPYFGNPALAFEPDLLVLTLCVNDIELMPDPQPRPETILLPKASHQYLNRRYRLYRFVHTRLNRLLASLGIQPSYAEYLQRLYRSETEEWQQFKEYFRIIALTAKERQKPLLVVLFPALEQLDETHPYLDLYAKVAELARAHAVEVLSLFPEFEGKDAPAFRVSLMNGHPNEHAYEITAEAIYQTIVDRNLLILP